MSPGVHRVIFSWQQRHTGRGLCMDRNAVKPGHQRRKLGLLRRYTVNFWRFTEHFSIIFQLRALSKVLSSDPQSYADIELITAMSSLESWLSQC